MILEYGSISKILSLFLVVSFCACNHPDQKKVKKLVDEWQGKEILFPDNSVFTYYGKDTVPGFPAGSGYKILMYVDTTGCMSCRLQLERWSQWIAYLDTASAFPVSYLFYFHPKDPAELSDLLKYKSFHLPVCIDTDDRLNRLNRFPKEFRFQTFLLDTNNRVKVIGNPVDNMLVRDLYLKVLVPDKKKENHVPTRVEVSEPVIDMGRVRGSAPASVAFILRNTGSAPFVLTASSVDCGCLSVTYDKKPVAAGEKITVNVRFEPKEDGMFEKTVKLYGNMQDSPLILKIKGRVTE